MFQIGLLKRPTTFGISLPKKCAFLADIYDLASAVPVFRYIGIRLQPMYLFADICDLYVVFSEVPAVRYIVICGAEGSQR